jgi:hypothetical protein
VCALDSCAAGLGKMSGFCEHGDELSGSSIVQTMTEIRKNTQQKKMVSYRKTKEQYPRNVECRVTKENL